MYFNQPLGLVGDIETVIKLVNRVLVEAECRAVMPLESLQAQITTMLRLQEVHSAGAKPQ